MRLFRMVLLMLIIGLVALPAASLPVAQTDPAQCTTLVERAVQTVGTACDGLARNQACYGNQLIDVEFQPDQSLVFANAGDVVDLGAIQRISTTPFQNDTNQWGIALLKAQANLPDNLPGQNVTFLLFGDATLENPTPDMQLVKVETNITQGLECEQAPSGLLIQSPNGTQVEMALNGAEVILGSTVYITATTENELILATLEGAAVVSAFDQVRVVLQGDQITLPIDDEWIVNDTPSETQPYDPALLPYLPVSLLDDPVPLPPAPPVPGLSTPTVTPVLCLPRPDWTQRYTVQSGDTLADIARRAGVSFPELQVANCIADPNVIRAGDVLVVPIMVPTRVPPTVVPGATFYATPSTINLGQCTTVAWNVTGAVTSIMIGQNSVAAQGSVTDCSFQVTSTLVMYVYRPDDTVEMYSTTVTVVDICGDSICGFTENNSICPADCPPVTF